MSLRSFVFLTLLATISAGAQTLLPDPTRPPAGLHAAGAAAPVEPDALVLQSVLLGSGRAPAAVISGRLVAVGDMVGDARISRITAHAVQMQGAQGTTTLTLVPEGQKTTRAARPESSK